VPTVSLTVVEGTISANRAWSGIGIEQSVRAVKPPVRRSPMAGKQGAPEVKGEFSKGNEPLQELRQLNTEVIVDHTEYPEVQRK
jgi:hypothetical protein